MDLKTHTNTHTHTHVQAHIQTYTYTHAHAYYKHTHIHTNTHTHTHKIYKPKHTYIGFRNVSGNESYPKGRKEKSKELMGERKKD